MLAVLQAAASALSDTGWILGRSPTGAYPDGLAYDPGNGTIWTTNESGGSETVIDAATGARRGTVRFGGVVVGNVAYDRSRATSWWTCKAKTSSP